MVGVRCGGLISHYAGNGLVGKTAGAKAEGCADTIYRDAPPCSRST